jgi:hypothetical protein
MEELKKVKMGVQRFQKYKDKIEEMKEEKNELVEKKG